MYPRHFSFYAENFVVSVLYNAFLKQKINSQQGFKWRYGMEKHLLKQAVTYMFNKKETILVQPSENLDASFKTQKEQVDFVAAMLTNLHDLGYEIPNRDIAKLLTMSPEDLNEYVYQPILQAAREQKGAHVEHNLLFKGFPESIKGLDESVLSNIRFMSYWTTAVESAWGMRTHQDGSLTRNFVEHALKVARLDVDARAKNDTELLQDAAKAIDKKKEERGLTEDKSKIRTIRVATEEDYFQMVKNMLSARAALPEYDKELVLFTVDNFPKEKYMPEKVQFRETQALLDVHNFRNGRYENIDIRTYKDFERLLAALSDGDVSLSKKQHYANFSNADRKALAHVFEMAVKNNRPTMVASLATPRGEQFTENVLKRRLHLNAQGPKSYFKDKELWKKLSDETSKYRTVMSYFEEHMKNKEYARAAQVLERHSPTLLMQHAREIIGKAYQEKVSVDSASYMTKMESQLSKAMIASEISNAEAAIRSAAKKTDVVTLLKTMTQANFDNIDVKIIRNAKANDWIAKENKSAKLTPEATVALTSIVMSALEYQYKVAPVNEQLPITKGTKVYAEPALSGCPMPTDDRAAEGKNRLLTAGTRVPMAEGDTLQVSLYKKAEHDQYIDHSFVVLDENYKPVLRGAWNGMQNVIHGKTISCFSGDNRRCSEGVTETHRINLDNLKELCPQGRYIAFAAIMWEGNPLNNAQELFMMAETFNAADRELKTTPSAIAEKDVQMKLDITGTKAAAMPMMYDIKENAMVVVNVEFSKMHGAITLDEMLRSPLHFDLPANCQAMENYQTEVALKCFAVNRPTMNTIDIPVHAMVHARGAVLVDKPELAEVVLTTGQKNFKDERPVIEGQPNPERKIVTIYDKDVLLAGLVPDMKAVEQAERQRMTERRQTRVAEKAERYEARHARDEGPQFER